jgi:peptidoglycan/LPS O-acetylase OafA/YrhL
MTAAVIQPVPAAGLAPARGILRRRFGSLDGLRALGALGVLSTHVGFASGDALNGPFRGLLARLDVGVAVFFAISGFLLYRPHLVAMVESRSRPRTRTYLWHRGLRILPALWIATLMAGVLLAHDRAVGLGLYLKHALLIHIYFENHQVGGLSQMWSLATEGAFYVLLPLLAWLLSRLGLSNRTDVHRQLMILGLFGVAGPTWMAVVAASGHPSSGLWLPGYLGWFGAGMALAVWQVARSQGLLPDGFPGKLAAYPGTVWACALAVFALATSPLAGPYGLSPATPGQAALKNLLYAVLALLIVFPAVACLDETAEPRAVRALGGRVGHYLGDISYGVFAYHVVVLGVVERLTGHVAFTGRFATLFWLTLSVSVALATLSYRFVERPIMRRGRRDRRFDVSPPPEEAAAGDSAPHAAAQATAKASNVRH